MNAPAIALERAKMHMENVSRATTSTAAFERSALGHEHVVSKASLRVPLRTPYFTTEDFTRTSDENQPQAFRPPFDDSTSAKLLSEADEITKVITNTDDIDVSCNNEESRENNEADEKGERNGRGMRVSWLPNWLTNRRRDDNNDRLATESAENPPFDDLADLHIPENANPSDNAHVQCVEEETPIVIARDYYKMRRALSRLAPIARLFIAVEGEEYVQSHLKEAPQPAELDHRDEVRDYLERRRIKRRARVARVFCMQA